MKRNKKKKSRTPPDKKGARREPRGGYGGYRGSAPAAFRGAINEFEDNLNVDWEDDRSTGISTANRIRTGRWWSPYEEDFTMEEKNYGADRHVSERHNVSDERLPEEKSKKRRRHRLY